MDKPLSFNIDFDGTAVTHDYPEVGKEIGAVPVLRELSNRGHKLILFTMRSGEELQHAVDWFAKHNLPLYGVQKNPTQHTWTDSPKSYANFMIDDSAIGAPLKHDSILSRRPFIDWAEVRADLVRRGILEPPDAT